MNVDVLMTSLPGFFTDLQIMVGCIVQGIARTYTVKSFSLMLDHNLVSLTVAEAIKILFSETKSITSMQLDLPELITNQLKSTCFSSTSLAVLYYKTGFASIPTHSGLTFLALGQPVTTPYVEILNCLNIQDLSICVDTVDHCVKLFKTVDAHLKLRAFRVKFLNQCIVDT